MEFSTEILYDKINVDRVDIRDSNQNILYTFANVSLRRTKRAWDPLDPSAVYVKHHRIMFNSTQAAKDDATANYPAYIATIVNDAITPGMITSYANYLATQP